MIKTIESTVRWVAIEKVVRWFKNGLGSMLSALPVRKWPAVSAEMSSGSSLRGSSDRKFRMASIWVSNVLSSSDVRTVSLTVRLRWNLTDFTTAFHLPPVCDAAGRVKRHWVRSGKGSAALVRCSWVLWLKIWRREASALMNLVPQSKYRVCAIPRRGAKRR